MAGFLSSRKDILDKDILGKQVFLNAAGFLRIYDPTRGGLNPVDDTRIHPEAYITTSRCRQMCGDTLDIEIDVSPERPEPHDLVTVFLLSQEDDDQKFFEAVESVTRDSQERVQVRSNSETDD